MKRFLVLGSATLRSYVVVICMICFIFITPTSHMLFAQGFDVASIRPSTSSTNQGSFKRLDDGILVISGMTVRELMSTAYGLRDYEIRGGPKWINVRRYDISAKDLAISDTHTLSDQQWKTALARDFDKLQMLLVEGFQLKTHVEQVQVPILALVISRKGSLQSATCMDKYHLSIGMAKGQIRLSSLAAQLSHDMNRPVLDATGLDGCYNIDLRWTQDPDNTKIPYITAALTDIGLRLDRRNGSGQVTVVDHLEEPSPN